MSDPTFYSCAPARAVVTPGLLTWADAHATAPSLYAWYAARLAAAPTQKLLSGASPYGAVSQYFRSADEAL